MPPGTSLQILRRGCATAQLSCGRWPRGGHHGPRIRESLLLTGPENPAGSRRETADMPSALCRCALRVGAALVVAAPVVGCSRESRTNFITGSQLAKAVNRE